MLVEGPLATTITTQQTTANGSTSIRALSGIKNGYILKDESIDTFSVKKREGYETAFTVDSAAGTLVNSIFADPVDSTYVYCIGQTDKKLYRNNSIVGSAMSNIGTSAAIAVDWASDASYVYMHSYGANGDNSYYFNKSAVTTNDITDADHPANHVTPLDLARGVVNLNGYFFVATKSGRIYNSALNNPASWGAADFIAAVQEPDNLNAIAKHYNTLVAFGDHTIEFFYDAGNSTGSPLSKRQDLVLPMGIKSGTLPIYHGDTLFFIGHSAKSEVTKTSVEQEHIYMMSNYQIKKISTPDIDHIINRITSQITGIVSVGGKNFLVIDVGTSTSYTSLVFDIELEVWYNWTIRSTLGISGNYFASGSSLIVSRFPTSTTNALYTDAASNFEFNIVTIKADKIQEFKTNTQGLRKYCNYLQITADRPASATSVDVSWSDDDYQNFTTARTLDISSYNKLSRLGSFRERAFKVAYTGNAGIRLHSLQLDVDLGKN